MFALIFLSNAALMLRGLNVQCTLCLRIFSVKVPNDYVL